MNKLRILHTVKYYSPNKGGMESVVKQLAEGVVNSAGFHVSVYCNQHQEIKESNQIFNNDIVTVWREKTRFFIKSQPVTVHYKKLSELIAQHDVIHHHYPFPNMEMALIRNKKLLKDKKLILTWHANIENSRWKNLSKVYQGVIDPLLRICDTIIVTSPQLAANSTILQPHMHKVQVLPLGYDEELFQGVDFDRAISDDRPMKLLFVGSLRSYKGVDILLNAIADMEVQLDIVGHGEEENRLKRLVKLLRIENKVSFHDNVDERHLVEFYRQADLFILPSVNEAEAFGVVQLEAMAMGLPVINTNVRSGAPFVSISGETGFTVAPGSVAELRAAIEETKNNPTLYQTFSRNALERVKLFKKEKLIRSLIEIYRF